MTLEDRIARLNDVLCAVNALNWDSRTQMPSGGAEARGHQVATLMGMAHDMILDPALKDAAQAVSDNASDLDCRAARAVLDAIRHHTRLPADLLRAQAEGSAVAAAAWAEAPAGSDFAIFRPHLERIVRLAREQAMASGDHAHPYDPMVRIYEPNETAATLDTLFDDLRAGILPILDAARGRPKPRTNFLHRDYPRSNAGGGRIVSQGVDVTSSSTCIRR